jgi:predicted DNA-binding antitoxin AbrB/MazE fold protein
MVVLSGRIGINAKGRSNWTFTISPRYALSMTIHTDAIFEAGVLRPLTPLCLQENQVVSLAISTPSETSGSEGEAARQREIIATYVAKMESQPDGTPQDGMSNRDHDRLIYGQ